MTAPRALLVALALLGIPLAGCLSADVADPAPETDADTLPEGPGGRAADVFDFTGKVSGVPVLPGSVPFTVPVPVGSSEVRANLSWKSPVADLALVLVDPDGKEVDRGWGETSTNKAVATVDPPKPGNWTVKVLGTRAHEEPFTLTVEVGRELPVHALLNKTYTVEPGSFAEVNLILEANATFSYKWALVQGESVDFNIHSHKDGKTQYHERKTGASHEGTFTTTDRGVYSLLWANRGVATVVLETTIEGPFRVHSLNHH